MTKENKMGNAFYEGNSWFHRVKLLQTDGTVKYSKKGGFQTEAEAEASYKRCAEEFKKSIRTLQASEKSHAEIGLRDYLIYWFEEVFSERVENSTRMVCAYTLYDLILPNLQQDIKLRYANVDYYDALLAIVAKRAVGLELGTGIAVPVGSGCIFADGAVELRSDYTNFNATFGYKIAF